VIGDHALPGMGFGQLLTGVGIYTQFERGKPADTPNAPYWAARVKEPVIHACRFHIPLLVKHLHTQTHAGSRFLQG
jgi:hypothetical protein